MLEIISIKTNQVKENNSNFLKKSKNNFFKNDYKNYEGKLKQFL